MDATEPSSCAMSRNVTHRQDFVRTHTAVAVPPLVPEVRLHLATEITPLWEATEATLQMNGLPPPYWAFAWPGGQALARHVLDYPETVQGRRVLDFAAGSGIAAIAAAKAGAAEVVAADSDPFAAAAIALNAAANVVALRVMAEDIVGSAGGWEVVLAGDVCYERPMAERTTAWLRWLAMDGATILLADPGRAYVPGYGLSERARYQVPTSRELEDRTVRETVIWRVMPR
jgi:predicted nicotinamide N-methyase